MAGEGKLNPESYGYYDKKVEGELSPRERALLNLLDELGEETKEQFIEEMILYLRGRKYLGTKPSPDDTTEESPDDTPEDLSKLSPEDKLKYFPES
ncbi:MAG: hypothetical protein LBC95_01315 [Candidatus Nomurabacteria bacterium]|jgi:hypothetical protein|nr:hypothetical protein [Candidatus Nomurabacteria bacterium]